MLPFLSHPTRRIPQQTPLRPLQSPSLQPLPAAPLLSLVPPATRSCSDAARTSYLVSPLLSCPFHLLLSQWPAGSFKKQVDS